MSAKNILLFLFIPALSFSFFSFIIYYQNSIRRDVVAPTTAVIQFPPSGLSLEKIFQKDHAWTATLSAEKIVTIIATGDVIPARSVNYQALRKNDFRWAFEKTADMLRDADITVINLESPLTKDCPLTNEGMIFCGDPRHIDGLIYAGVDIATFANNHMENYGEKGVEETVALLKSTDILPVGFPLETAIKDIRGLRFAFLAYNDVPDGGKIVNIANEDKITSDIAKMKEIADIIIVAFHWGIEYTSIPSDRQKQLAHLSIDSGADLVLGNHPHWIQPVEIYKDKLIVYAHGNFIFDQMWSEKTKEGAIGRYVFYGGKLIDAEFTPIYISNFGQPDFPNSQKKEQIMEYLMKSVEQQK